MMITWQIERTQPNSLRTQCVFVLLYDDGTETYRLFEAAFVPLEADVQTHIQNNYDAAWMWQQGQPVEGSRLETALVRARADDILDDIDADLAALPAATAAETKTILGHALQQQRRMVRVLAFMLKER